MNDGVLLPLLPDVNGDALAQLRNGRFVSCEGLVWWIKAYREATLASLEDACRAAAAAIVRRGKHARWDVVILPPDGDPEGSVWGCGPTRHAALDHAVCDLRESLGEDLEPGEDFSAVAYRDAVWQDVRDKCWDAEVVGYAERVAISIKVGPSSYLLLGDEDVAPDRRGATEPESAPRCPRCGVALGYHADDLSSACADCASASERDGW